MRNFIMSSLASAVILGSAFGAQAQAVTVESVADACVAGPCGPQLQALADQATAAGQSADAAVQGVVSQVAQAAPGRVADTVATVVRLRIVSAGTNQELQRVAEAAAAAGPDIQTAAGPGAGAADTNNNGDSNSNGNTIPPIAASAN